MISLTLQSFTLVIYISSAAYVYRVYKNTEFHKLLTMDDPLCECKIFPRSNDPKLRGVQTASDIPFSCVDTKLSSFTFEERFWKVLCTYMYTVLAL